jgi:hypothetical protein
LTAASLEMFSTTLPSSLASRCGQRAEQRLRQTKRAEHVGRERALEVFALRIAEQRERRRAESGRVVDEHRPAA